MSLCGIWRSWFVCFPSPVEMSRTCWNHYSWLSSHQITQTESRKYTNDFGYFYFFEKSGHQKSEHLKKARVGILIFSNSTKGIPTRTHLLKTKYEMETFHIFNSTEGPLHPPTSPPTRPTTAPPSWLILTSPNLFGLYSPHHHQKPIRPTRDETAEELGYKNKNWVG